MRQNKSLGMVVFMKFDKGWQVFSLRIYDARRKFARLNDQREKVVKVKLERNGGKSTILFDFPFWLLALVEGNWYFYVTLVFNLELMDESWQLLKEIDLAGDEICLREFRNWDLVCFSGSCGSLWCSLCSGSSWRALLSSFPRTLFRPSRKVSLMMRSDA